MAEFCGKIVYLKGKNILLYNTNYMLTSDFGSVIHFISNKTICEVLVIL